MEFVQRAVMNISDGERSIHIPARASTQITVGTDLRWTEQKLAGAEHVYEAPVGQRGSNFRHIDVGNSATPIVIILANNDGCAADFR